MVSNSCIEINPQIEKINNENDPELDCPFGNILENDDHGFNSSLDVSYKDTNTINKKDEGKCTSLPYNKSNDIKQLVYNEYNSKDEGPYRVIIERHNDSLHINKIAIGRWLKNIVVSDAIIEIKKIGKKKVVVYFKNLEEANNLIKIKQHENYLIYLPTHFITVKGVVTGIPQDIPMELLKSEIDCDVPIIDMYRMKRFVNNESIESDRICITFRSNFLPQYAKLWYCRSKVEPFVPRIIICLNCLRFNHLAGNNNCKGKKRCQNCSSAKCENMNEKCESDTMCLYCKRNHKTTDREICKEWQNQKKIKTIMAKRAMIFQEVNDELEFLSRNRYEILNDNTSLSVYEAYADMKKKCVKKNAETQSGMKKIRTDINLIKEKLTPIETAVPRKRRFKEVEEEENGVALNNPFKVNEVEKEKQAAKSEIEKLERHYQTVLYKVYQKSGLIENAKELTFEIEKNLKYQYIQNNNLQIPDQG